MSSESWLPHCENFIDKCKVCVQKYACCVRHITYYYGLYDIHYLVR